MHVYQKQMSKCHLKKNKICIFFSQKDHMEKDKRKASKESRAGLVVVENNYGARTNLFFSLNLSLNFFR
jgi:hypothetical protein